MLKKFTILLVSTLCCIFILVNINGMGLAQTIGIQPPSPTPNSIREDLLKAKWQYRLTGQISDVKPGIDYAQFLSPSKPDSGNNYYWMKVAFQSWIDNNFEVVIADSDGNNMQRLTYHPANDGRARLDFGGKRVVFTSDRDNHDYEIFSMNVDGSNLRQLTSNNSMETKPAWSPDGKRIVYSSNEDGRFEIFSMNADGSEKQQLTYSTNVDCLDPSWSPDGKFIAYAMIRNDYYGRIWYVPSAGGASTPFGDYDNYLLPGDPIWSQNDRYVAFDSADIYNYFITRAHLINRSTGYIDVFNILGGQYEDHYLGGWSTDSDRIMFNRINYTYSAGEWYITEASVETQWILDFNDVFILPGTGLDFLPDWHTLDNEPPVTRIERLPRYSHWDGFPIQFSTWASGIAPFEGLTLQYRKEGESAWKGVSLYAPWSKQQWLNVGGFNDPGDSLYFRSRSYDVADNIEPFPTSLNGEGKTTLYTYRAEGDITDNRGRPLADYSLLIDPAPIGQDNKPGHYQAWLSSENGFNLSTISSGYGPVPVTWRNPHSDIAQSIIYPPQDDLLIDGSFEAGSLAGWSVGFPFPADADLSIIATDVYRHLGTWGVTIGSNCDYPCLTPTEKFIPVAVNNIEFANDDLFLEKQIAMAVDPNGLVYITNWSWGGLDVFTRAPDGTWSGPVNLEPVFSGSPILNYIAVTPAGEVIAIWRMPGELYKYKIAVKPANGSWEVSSFPIEEYAMKISDIYMDQEGVIHLVYGPGFKYTYRSTSGSWSTPIRIGNTIYDEPDGITLTSTPDKTLHIFWRGDFPGGKGIVYKTLRQDGTKGVSLNLFPPSNLATPSSWMLADTDDQGQVHFFMSVAGTVVHFTRNTNGGWLASEDLPKEIPIPLSVKSAKSMIHTLIDSGTRYGCWTHEQGWFVPPNITGLGSIMVVDENGSIHTASSSGYNTIQRASKSSQISLSQSVTLPTTLHKPTLSFMSRLRGGPISPSSDYTVTISESGVVKPVYLEGSLHPWKQTWLPLDEWIGKEITLTFTLNQAAGEPNVYLDLDDISIGSWLTPVIQSVTPSDILEPMPGETITISGENFIEEPAIFLDETLVDPDSVTWLDENTLEMLLPEPALARSLDVKVVNPAGQAAIAPDALRIGHFYFVPLVGR